MWDTDIMVSRMKVAPRWQNPRDGALFQVLLKWSNRELLYSDCKMILLPPKWRMGRRKTVSASVFSFHSCLEQGGVLTAAHAATTSRKVSSYCLHITSTWEWGCRVFLSPWCFSFTHTHVCIVTQAHSNRAMIGVCVVFSLKTWTEHFQTTSSSARRQTRVCRRRCTTCCWPTVTTIPPWATAR